MVTWKVLRYNFVGLGVWLQRLQGVHPLWWRRLGKWCVVVVVAGGGVAEGGGVVGVAGVRWVAIIWMQMFGWRRLDERLDEDHASG